MSMCSNCGHPNGELENRCANCGTNLVDPDLTARKDEDSGRKLKAHGSHEEALAKKLVVADGTPGWAMSMMEMMTSMKNDVQELKAEWEHLAANATKRPRWRRQLRKRRCRPQRM